MIGEAMMITWAGYGLKIEKQNESQESLEMYISVPEKSFHLNSKGEEMAGQTLAHRFKEVLTDMGVKRLTVKSRIRVGESWTKVMSKEAELDIKRLVYSSQY